MVETDIQRDESAARTRMAAAAIDENAVHVRQSAIGMMRTVSATVRQAAVGAVFARRDVSVAQGGGRLFVAGGDLSIRQGGGGMFVAGGDAEIREGGVGTLVALGGTTIERGGAAVALTGSVELREGGIVGIALSPRIAVHPGGRVLVGIREAGLAGVIGGLVVGVVVVLARRLTGR